MVSSDHELFTEFINKYNLAHIKKEEKNKSLSDIHSKLVKFSKNKIELGEATNNILESTKKNVVLLKIINEMIQHECHTDLQHIIKNNQ